MLAYDRLRQRREDLIVLRVMGRADGTPAGDYTVNSAIGIPQMTGPASLGDEPVNHVLPAWDLLTGAYAAFALLAAERSRRETGKGQEIRLPLSAMAIASLGHICQIAEVAVSGADRPRYGNDLFGAFGRDFVTRDGLRVMIVAITTRQWSGLVEALEIGAAIKDVETEMNVSFDRDEGMRFRHRDRLDALVAAAVAARPCAARRRFRREGVCWGPPDIVRAVAEDPDLSVANPLCRWSALPAMNI